MEINISSHKRCNGMSNILRHDSEKQTTITQLYLRKNQANKEDMFVTSIFSYATTFLQSVTREP